MAPDDSESELEEVEQEVARTVAYLRRLVDRAEELRTEKPQGRHLRGLPAVAAIGTAAAAAWHKAASHPAASSGLAALIAVAVASVLWLSGSDNASDSPPVASPPTQSSSETPTSPPTSEPPAPTLDNPPTTTPGSEPERGTEPSARWTAVPVANIEQAAPTQPGQPPERSIPEPPSPPDDRNETPPPEPPGEGPPTDAPPGTQPPSTPDCTGLHLDASPLAEVCALGDSLLEVEVLG